MVKDHSYELVAAGLGPCVSDCTRRLSKSPKRILGISEAQKCGEKDGKTN